MKSHNGKCNENFVSKKHACYVLITCTEPTEDGGMNVEFTYEGDATLASYLLQNASMMMEEKEEEEEICSDKILRIGY